MKDPDAFLQIQAICAERLEKHRRDNALQVRLDVPYFSQWGPGADVRRGDCGPACVSMIAAYKVGTPVSVDRMADYCGQPSAGVGSQYTGHANLRKGALACGVSLKTVSPAGAGLGLKPYLIDLHLYNGNPVIALIHYGVLRDELNHYSPDEYTYNQDVNYDRGHWCLVVGYGDDFYLIHDPDFWGNRTLEGAWRKVPRLAFDEALRSVAPGCTMGHQGLVIE